METKTKVFLQDLIAGKKGEAYAVFAFVKDPENNERILSTAAINDWQKLEIVGVLQSTNNRILNDLLDDGV